MNTKGNANDLKSAVKTYFQNPSNIKAFYESELSGIRWNGSGQGVALCPFHEDNRPSLSIDAQTGLFHCFGCDAKGDVIEFYKARYSLSFPEAIRRLAEKLGISKPERKIIKIYDYLDAEGRLVFQVIRYEPKGFSQRRPDPDNKGRWLYDLKGVQLIPYNLPALIKSNYCIIVEGEKDVETLRGLGLVASTCPMGAGKWRESYNEYFQSKRCYIIPDNDAVGQSHAQMVAKSLKGFAESIKVIELPGLPIKGDVSDWLNSGYTKEELVSLLKSAPEWVDTDSKTPKGLVDSLLKWNDVHNLNIETEWLLDKLIPEGAISILFGKGGIGKTSLALQIVHAIAEGQEFAGLKTKQVSVTYIDLENPLSVLKERITCLGKTENVLIWHGSCEPAPPRLDKGEEWKRLLDLPKGLLVFDTLRASFLGDENDSQDVAIVISRLKELRDKGYSILLLHHSPKSSDSIYKGSTAILDLVDHALCLEPVKEGEDVFEDFDPDRLFKFGTKQKTRFEPFHIFLKFNPEIKGFDFAGDPNTEDLESIHQLLEGKGELNTNQIFEIVKNELGIKNKHRVIRLLKKGDGQFWDSEKRGRAIFYRFKSLPLYIPKPLNRSGENTIENGLGGANSNKVQNRINTEWFNGLDPIQTDKPIGYENGLANSEKLDSLKPIVRGDSGIIDLTNEDFEVIE